MNEQINELKKWTNKLINMLSCVIWKHIKWYVLHAVCSAFWTYSHKHIKSTTEWMECTYSVSKEWVSATETDQDNVKQPMH